MAPPLHKVLCWLVIFGPPLGVLIGCVLDDGVGLEEWCPEERPSPGGRYTYCKPVNGYEGSWRTDDRCGYCICAQGARYGYGYDIDFDSPDLENYWCDPIDSSKKGKLIFALVCVSFLASVCGYSLFLLQRKEDGVGVGDGDGDGNLADYSRCADFENDGEVRRKGEGPEVPVGSMRSMVAEPGSIRT